MEYPSRLKFSAIKYSADKHSVLLKFSRFCCDQSTKGSALWLLKLSATKYSADKHSALKFIRFCYEQSAEGSALCFLKLSVTKYSADEHSAFLRLSRFCCKQSVEGFALFATKFMRRDILHFWKSLLRDTLRRKL